MLDFGIYGTAGRRCQADAQARCGGVSDFGTYHDTILYLFTWFENEAPRVFAMWVPCIPRIIPLLDNAQACSNKWGNVPTLLNITQKAIDAINVGNMMNFIAVMTDNLTMMQAYQHEL